MKKLNSQIIDDRISEYDLQIKRIDEYAGLRISITFKCLKSGCGKFWKARPGNIIGSNRRGCPHCHTTSKYTDQRIDAKLANRTIKRIENIGINNCNYQLEFQCLKESCKHIWRAGLTQVMNSKTGCPKCVSFSQRLTNEDFDKKFKNNKFQRIDNYITAWDYIRLRCLRCEHVWKVQPGCMHPGQGCPICIRKNEKLVFEMISNHSEAYHDYKLNKINSSFIFRHAFDVFIPIDNKYIGIAVEYNGHQHYQPTTFGKMSEDNAISAFERQKIRDAQKRDFCVENNIFFMEIDGREYIADNLVNYMEETILPKIENLKK